MLRNGMCRIQWIRCHCSRLLTGRIDVTSVVGRCIAVSVVGRCVAIRLDRIVTRSQPVVSPFAW